jgi:asparaginyl-tRNA synthetase
MKAYIEKIADFKDKEVEISGWLYNKRSSGKIHFLEIRDGTGFIQVVVVKGQVDEGIFELCDKISQESSVVVIGKVREEPRAPGGYELDLKSIQVIGQAEVYPLQKKEHGIDFLLSNRHLWLRSKTPWAIIRIRDEVIRSIIDFFHSKDFIKLDAPIFTPSACEGTTTLFEVPYFDQKVYLSQSGQLYGEAGCMAFNKIYTFGPTFRAEASKTRRHLTEFWQIEPEVAYAKLDDIMELAEQFVTYIVQRVLENRQKELKMLERDVTILEKIKVPFYRISYSEAIEMVKKQSVSGGEVPILQWGDDFGAPQETYIASQFDKPVFVHRYPTKCKAFYMKPDPENPEVVLCTDLLASEGYGEIIGGSQREESIQALEKKIEKEGLPKEAHEWYLDLRRYGSVPHSGFGLGLERLVTWICGLHHIRETIPFPRTIDRVSP